MIIHTYKTKHWNNNISSGRYDSSNYIDTNMPIKVDRSEIVRGKYSKKSISISQDPRKIVSNFLFKEFKTTYPDNSLASSDEFKQDFKAMNLIIETLDWMGVL